MEPQFEDETPLNPFDLWEGAPFKLKIRQVDGYRNYDKSEFGTPAPLSDDDSELEKIWKSEYSLQEFLDPKNFKSREELETRLAKALGGSNVRTSNKRAVDTDIEEEEEPPFKTSNAPNYGSIDEDDDDSIEFFKGLAK